MVVFVLQYSKLQAEFSAVKTKLEKDLMTKTEEYEELRYLLFMSIEAVTLSKQQVCYWL